MQSFQFMQFQAQQRKNLDRVHVRIRFDLGDWTLETIKNDMSVDKQSCFPEAIWLFSNFSTPFKFNFENSI